MFINTYCKVQVGHENDTVPEKYIGNLKSKGSRCGTITKTKQHHIGTSSSDMIIDTQHV